jgi:hypothetical protein
MEALYREGLLEQFYSPHFKSLPPAAFPKHRHYAADRFNFFTIAYNTKLVKPDEVPDELRGPAQSALGRQDRHRRQRRRLVCLHRQVHGRKEGARLLPQARPDEAAGAHRAHAARRAGRAGEIRSWPPFTTTTPSGCW